MITIIVIIIIITTTIIITIIIIIIRIFFNQVFLNKATNLEIFLFLNLP